MASRTSTADVLLQLTKFNLRQFVERWSSHPNSPYGCDDGTTLTSVRRTTVSLLSPDGVLCWSRTSLTGMSPSPPCSGDSSVGFSSPWSGHTPPPEMADDAEPFCHYKVAAVIFISFYRVSQKIAFTQQYVHGQN